MIDLSIVIGSYNTKNLTLDCINSIFKYTKGINYEIVVYDNASTDGSVEALAALPKRIKIIKNKKNVGFAAGNSQGMKAAKGKYVLLLNSDTYLVDNVLGEMVFWMNKNPRIGVAGCALKSPDGNFQTNGGYFPTLFRIMNWMIFQDFPFVDRVFKQFHPKKNKPGIVDQDWVQGAFFFVRREVIERIGYIDERYFMYTEEVDFCYRAKKANFRVVYNPTWSITHIGGASSTGSEFSLLSEFKNIKLFYAKHYPAWQLPVLRLLLKIGALGRIVLFGILRGREQARIYAKAFWQA